MVCVASLSVLAVDLRSFSKRLLLLSGWRVRASASFSDDRWQGADGGELACGRFG